MSIGQKIMNELNYYDLAMADPYCTEPDFLSAVANDEVLQQLVNDAKGNDKILKSFMEDVPTPSQQHMDFINSIVDTPREVATVTSLPKRSFTGVKPYFAIAASFLVMTVSLFMFNNTDGHNQNLMNYALAHTSHGEFIARAVDARPTLTRVNNQLAVFGAKLKSANNITSSSNCDFQGIHGSHIVYQDHDNKVNVFLIPKTLSFNDIESRFGNARLNGSITELKHGYLVVVAPKSSNIDNLSNEIESQLEWDI